jgi:hypothetical protein
MKPLISVIIPLEYHRGQWDQCWRKWQTQTLPKNQYETILVVPPDFPERDKLPALLGPQDRLEYSNENHDIGLCAMGATRARGQFLFFTESHCLPESDVLEKCLEAFTTRPESVAFSCQSVRITHNQLSTAEADMYDADIEFGMNRHPWRKVLDQCFVTRRDVYDECGGLQSELGHFAEWILAANYAGLGYKIGYLPEARLHHYYIGDLAELRTFTRDFITGEMRYFANGTHQPGGHLLEVPDEWICQGSWDRRLAQGLLRISVHDMLVPSIFRLRQPFLFLRTPARWLMPAITGEGAALARAAAKLALAYAMTNLAILVGSQSRIGTAFKNYVAANIDYQRLICLKQQRRTATRTNSDWDVFAPQNAGFYPIETHKGITFRWSEPAAMMSAWMDKGRHQVSMQCLPVRSLAHAGLRFYVNGRPLPAQNISIGRDVIDMTFDLNQPGQCTLAWTCLRLHAKGDSRWLGLPVIRLVRKREGASSQS